ncbi:MAG: septal ring lytic transglycosylase RlpA family protein [Pseudomonadota bacterium]|nr:septal ring lytic transglycosylase RlpA family protein [Pseudomonadota bacterium]
MRERRRPAVSLLLGLGTACLAAVVLSGCSETQLAVHAAKRVAANTEPSAPERQVRQEKIRTASLRPYQIKGQWYYPAIDPNYDETGIASWYGEPFHGRPTATGERYDQNEVSAAHKTLPLPSLVRVTNLENGRVLEVRVNDRGPFVHGRIIDMSRRGAQLLGFERQGTARVRVQVVGAGTDEFVMTASEISREESGGVNAAPRQQVAVAALPPPDGVAGSAAVAASTPDRPAVAASRPVTATVPPSEPTVSIVPVQPTSIFVQAGSFTNFENANRLRARLSTIGPVRIDQALVNDRDFFRVRIGPMADVEAADAMLETALAAGADDARIIVD